VFTGLIETMGVLLDRAARGPGARLVVKAAFPDQEPFALGESIAVEGTCLSVDRIREGGFEADASAETLARTTLGSLAAGSPVNLERAAKLGSRLGGHIVTGHVDGVGSVVEKVAVGDALKVTFRMPRSLSRFVAEKGSVAVSGVSLTVNAAGPETFDVVLIPHTRAKTTLDGLAPGSPVNLEVDLLARYVVRALEGGASAPSDDAVWLERLRRAGYA
jgi:riboflavin synthase